MTDILERLRVTPTVTLPQAEAVIPVAKEIRRFLVERQEAADEITNLRALLRDLANRCDDVGVKHFDTDSMSVEVSLMQAATKSAREALARGRH